MNPNSTPPEGLSASVADSGGESKDRGAQAAKASQAGAQGVDPRAVLLDTISTALNRAGFWLAIEGRRAIVDAVIERRDQELELLRRAADPDDVRMVDEMLDEVRKRIAAEAAVERVRKAVAERRAEIADYEAENDPAPWSDAAANTCSRIEDALREPANPQGIPAALDEQPPTA